MNSSSNSVREFIPDADLVGKAISEIDEFLAGDIEPKFESLEEIYTNFLGIWPTTEIYFRKLQPDFMKFLIGTHEELVGSKIKDSKEVPPKIMEIAAAVNHTFQLWPGANVTLVKKYLEALLRKIEKLTE